MESQTKYSNLIFWLLQFVGWSMMSAVIFIIPELSYEYKIYSFLISVIIGILITNLYRLYLKKNIDFDKFDKASLLKLLVSFVICTIVYFIIFLPTDHLYALVWQKTEDELDWFKENFSFISSFISSAITILGWTVIYIAVKFIVNVNKNRMESLELRSTLKDAQLNTLKGQVNPHFMFNSLNNIRGLMLEDVDKSREMITKLSEMLQYALSKNSVDAIALREEVEMVDNYIALAKIQMEDRLHYKKEIAIETKDVMIPPMIIQLLVENAAKHGISNLKSGGCICLKTNIENEELLITVRNTGKLSISKDSTKLGLKNIQQRLRLLYGVKGAFSLEEVDDEVVATIKIPMT